MEEVININKRGQMSDTLAIPFFLFVLIIIAYAFYTIFTNMSAIPIFANNTATEKIVNDGINLMTGIDFSVPAILLALNIGSLLGMYFLRSKPILMIIVFIMIPITIFISAATSNAYISASTTLNLAATFPIADFVMSKLPVIEFVIDVLGAILLFAVI